MRRLLPLLLVLMVAGCAANPARGGMMFTTVSESQQRALGDAAAKDALKQFGLYRPDSKISHYVDDLCGKVWSATEDAGSPLTCIMLDSDEFNAWATPGYINIYKGLLPYINNEAELVAVLGHESGHIAARHFASMETRQMILSTVLGIGGAYVAARSNDSGTAAAVGLGTGIGAHAVMASYSRAHEREADALGQRYMAKLGYEPGEEVRMIAAMRQKEAYDAKVAAAFGEKNGGGLLQALYATHPPTAEREAAALRLAEGKDGNGAAIPGNFAAAKGDDPGGRRRYLEALNGMRYGPPRKDGIAGRASLMMPHERVRWQFPDGFIFRYQPADDAKTMGVWEGAHATSGVTVAVAVEKMQAGLSAAGIVDKLGAKDVQPLALDGGKATAYTGVAGPGLFGHTVRRVVAVALPWVDEAAVVTFTFPSEAVRQREEGVLMAELQKSQFVSEDGAKRWQPLVVFTFNAAAGDSVAREAGKLPSGALREAWFRALNGLKPDEEMVVGRMYKTVVDPNW